MSWKKKFDKRKKITNGKSNNPTISFRSNLSPETLAYIKELSKSNSKSEFINQAIEQRYFLIKNKREFLRSILRENYKLCRFLLRKIGNEK